MIALSDQEIVLRLAVAAMSGLAIGLERERVEQPAGLRDHALVAVGSSLIMIISAYGFGQVTHAPDVVLDPSRIAAQVISGIGFIGAGTIVLRQNVVRGLTTAASIWAAAALGLAAGGGLYFTAIVGTIVILIILGGIKSLERRFFRRYRRSIITLTVRRDAMTLQMLQTIASENGLRLDRIDVREAKGAPDQDRIELFLASSDRKSRRSSMRFADDPASRRFARPSSFRNPHHRLERIHLADSLWHSATFRGCCSFN